MVIFNGIEATSRMCGFTFAQEISAQKPYFNCFLFFFLSYVALQEFRNSVSESNVNSVGLDFVNPLQNVQPSRYSIFSSIVEATIEKQPDSIVTFEPLPKVLPTKFTSSVRLPQFNGNTNDIGFIEEWLGL